MPDALKPEPPEVGVAEDGQAIPTRLLGLDVGDRRIGLALCTEPVGIAQPLFTLHRTTERADLRSIGRVLRKHAITEMVVGLPLHLSGELSAQALKTMAFAEQLREQHPGIRLHLLDERLTTHEAHALLDRSHSARQGKRDRRERTAMIDQISAVLLLEAFLSVASPRLLPPPPEA